MLSSQLSLFVLHQVADIGLDAHKVGHMAPAVMNGCDGQVVDERITILLIVQQLNYAWLACTIRSDACRLGVMHAQLGVMHG